MERTLNMQERRAEKMKTLAGKQPPGKESPVCGQTRGKRALHYFRSMLNQMKASVSDGSEKRSSCNVLVYILCFLDGISSKLIKPTSCERGIRGRKKG